MFCPLFLFNLRAKELRNLSLNDNLCKFVVK
jgi:hypothetical protein